MSFTAENIQSINFASISSSGSALRALNIESTQLGNAIGSALELSETRAYRLTRGILSTVQDVNQYETEAKSMINWAKTGGSQERQLIAKAIRLDGGHRGNLFMVHSISEMKKSDARAFMADYFESGGNTKAVSEWLAIAGRVLRKHKVKETGTAKVVVDAATDAGEWLLDKAEDMVDSLAEAIESVVDAIIEAGKSLVDVIGDVMSWAIDEVGDLIQALLDVGESIGSILQAAWDFGTDAVNKFVRAIIDMGKAVGDVLEWAVDQTTEMLEAFVNGLFNAAVSVGRILEWAVDQVSDIRAKIVQTLSDLGRSISTILYSAFSMGVELVSSVTKALLDIGKTIGEVLVIAVTQPTNLFNEVVRALDEIGQSINQMFDELRQVAIDKLHAMATALIEIGKTVANVLAWTVDKASTIVKDVLEGILEAGKAVIDILATLGTATLAFYSKVTEALFDIGKTALGLLDDLISLGIDFTRKFFTALTEIAGGLARFAAEVVKLTYRNAAELVKALMDLGMQTLEILDTIVGASYWVFRRMVNGILENLGPVGEVLDWALTQAENYASEIWHDTLLAIRYADAEIRDAIDWAVSQGDEQLQAILNAWESIEEDLIDFYEQAATLAQAGNDLIFQYIGRATVYLENSIAYVLNYLEKDFLPGARDFIKGVMEAQYQLAALFVNIANLGVQALTEVTIALLDYGITLADLIKESVENPSEFLQNFLQAVEAAGQTMQDVYRAVIIDLGQDFIDEITNAWYEIGKSVKSILEASAEIAGGAVATVIGILLSRLASYRAMRPDEITEARKIYGDTFDYSRIYFSQESLSNDIIFGIQDWANDEEDSRAFVTNTLVNFDVNDGQIDYPTMIHELCHVWQYQDTGAFYMAEAIHAQTQWGKGYNYGYTDEDNGDGGRNDLNNALNDEDVNTVREAFELFNREQQAQIIMHYYVRRYQELRSPDEYAAWEPFQALVYS